MYGKLFSESFAARITAVRAESIPIYRNYSDVFTDHYYEDPKKIEKELEDLKFNAGSLGAVLRNRVDLKKPNNPSLPALIKPMGHSLNPLNLRVKGFMVKSERFESTKHPLGLFIGTVLVLQSGELFNTNPIPITQDDLAHGVGPYAIIPDAYIDLRVAKANNKLHPVNLGANDLSYDEHMDHLARFSVKFDLDKFAK